MVSVERSYRMIKAPAGGRPPATEVHDIRR